MTNLDSMFKSRDITLPTKVRLVKAMVFPVVMYGCESWTVKKAEHRSIQQKMIDVLDTAEKVHITGKGANKTDLYVSVYPLENPLYCKEIQPVHFEGYQPWDFFRSNDAKAETPVLWPPHAKS